MSRIKLTNYKKEVKCVLCGKVFLRIRPSTKLCSRECYAKYRSKIYKGKKHPMWIDGRYSVSKKCIVCGKKFIGEHIRKVCSTKCSAELKKTNGKGSRNGMWKGGRTGGGENYFYVLMPKHPFANKACYILEHRIVMEKIIGRYLAKDEVVHHKNNIKSDNRPKNLQLMKKKEHDSYHSLKRSRNLVELNKQVDLLR